MAPTAVASANAFLEEAAKAGKADEPLGQVKVGDFFKLKKPEAGFSLIFDYTFLCAIQPDMRAAWAKQVSIEVL